MNIGFLASKGKSNDFNLLSFKIISRNLAKQTKSCFPEIKSNQVNIICDQEEHKGLTCFCRDIKIVNHTLKIA